MLANVPTKGFKKVLFKLLLALIYKRTKKNMLQKKFAPINLDNNQEGIYTCSNCGQPLFDASKKFDAGCGFPSFYIHKGNAVKENALYTYGRDRIQLLCNSCGQHLGHLFKNNFTPTNLRYCISEKAILFKKM